MLISTLMKKSKVTSFVLCGLFLFSLSANGYSASQNNNPWRLVKKKDGISVYMQHNDYSKIKTFRGVTRYTTTSPLGFVGALNDYETMPSWLHFISKAKDLGRKNYLDRNVRFKTRMPWPVKDRDAVVNALVTQDPKTKDISIALTNRPRLIPKKDGYIRFPEFNGRFDFNWMGFTEKGEYIIEVTYEIIVDPGGAVPNWLANLIFDPPLPMARDIWSASR